LFLLSFKSHRDTSNSIDLPIRDNSDVTFQIP